MTHKQQFDLYVANGLRKQEDDIEIVKTLVNKLCILLQARERGLDVCF